jgi:hypothetical protein
MAARRRGVTWLGNGMIIGKNYFVDITILAAPAKVAERKETEQKKK